jgi:type IV pilus assembly protein PilE
MVANTIRTNSVFNKGFTLLELMIIVVVIGILSAVAYPSYRTSILKSHRSDAIATLSQDQAIVERCYAQTFSYTGNCPSLPAFPQTSSQGYYSITIANQTATTYTLTATAIGRQVLDTTCATMSVDQANQKRATNPTCWTP